MTGIVTARDNLAIDFEKHSLKNKIMMFRNKDLPDEIVRDGLKLKDNYQWKLTEQRKLFQKVNDWEKYFTQILYRPFDVRYIYFQDNIVFRTRHEVMRHMLEENISLCFMRQFSGNIPYTHFLITEQIVDNRTFFSSKGIIQQAPLYLYPDKNKKDLFNQHQVEKEPNIPTAIFEKLESVYVQRPSPEAILYYIYGVFYGNIYRETYAEFLKIDFPRVPFTANYELFKQMAEFGKQLADLHLLKSPALDPPIAKYQGSGTNDRIEKITYKENERRVYINKDKYFEDVAPEVWNYHIGGYQVLRKYLKDRKGRNIDDAPRYCRIVTALSKTIEIQLKIDEIYPEVEKELVQF